MRLTKSQTNYVGKNADFSTLNLPVHIDFKGFDASRISVCVPSSGRVIRDWWTGNGVEGRSWHKSGFVAVFTERYWERTWKNSESAISLPKFETGTIRTKISSVSFQESWSSVRRIYKVRSQNCEKWLLASSCVCLSVSLSVFLSLSVCMSFSLSVYLSVCLSVSLSICLSLSLSVRTKQFGSLWSIFMKIQIQKFSKICPGKSNVMCTQYVVKHNLVLVGMLIY